MHKFTNREISSLLRNVAATYSIIDEKKHRFQIIAYQKASETIDGLSTEIMDLFVQNSLDKIPGVGESMRSHLQELFTTGHVVHFEKIMENLSPAVFPLLDIPTFGPKKAFKLVEAFHLDNSSTVIDDVYDLAQKGKIAPLDTFGEKSQADIKRAIDEYRLGKTKSSRMVLPLAKELADKFVAYLKENKHVKEVFPLGSLRRMKSTIGDVDIAVASNRPAEVLKHFVAYPYKERIIEQGDITSSLVVSGNKQIDLMVLKPDQLGSLLQHFSGSKQHNVALREYAIKKGFSLSEKGIKLKDGTTKTFTDEKAFYNYLGLDWIPPEMRENTGEIEAAKAHQLPDLVELKDIKGDLHIHSNYPIEPSHDLGANTMQEMIDRAIELKYEYIGFSEHNPSVGNHTSDQIYSILARRNEKIEQLKLSNKNIRIINLLEIDILANGNLALDNKSLELIDLGIVSIHSSFKTEKKDMTKRILSGLSHPKAKIFAHPTGRLINQRDGYDVEWEKLFSFVQENNKALEINSWPTRLDLVDTLARQAKDMGVSFVIDTDSHAVSHMDNMFYGISVARRAWCEKKNILNSLPFEKFWAWTQS